jgi:taurine dioxygenase
MQTKSPIVIHAIAQFLGAEISGIDASKLILSDVLTQLKSALIEHQLLVLRNQNLNVEQQIVFCRNFGELETFSPHPQYLKYPEIFPVSNRQEDGYLNVGQLQVLSTIFSGFTY